jgi:segregation and condensation protein B
MTDQQSPSAHHSLRLQAEALIFISGEPLARAELARVLELSEDAVGSLLDAIAFDYAQRGIRLQQHLNHVQFVSAPEAAPAIERFLRVDAGSSRLSNAALETLAVVAYRQPVTRPGIEAVRGVDVSGPLRTLQQRGLVAEVGRLPTAGRPVLYGTTDEFLRQFGLGSLDELPPLPEEPTTAQEPVLPHL